MSDKRAGRSAGKKPKAASDPTKKVRATLSDADLDKVSGGTKISFDDDGGGVHIPGPSWVNLMAYRKAGWGVERSRRRSATEVFNEIAAKSPSEK